MWHDAGIAAIGQGLEVARAGSARWADPGLRPDLPFKLRESLRANELYNQFVSFQLVDMLWKPYALESCHYDYTITISII